MSEDETMPRRRLHLTLNMGADDLREAANELWKIAHDLEIEGREEREVVSGGWASGYHLTVHVTNPAMDGDRYREELKKWSAERQRQRSKP